VTIVTRIPTAALLSRPLVYREKKLKNKFSSLGSGNPDRERDGGKGNKAQSNKIIGLKSFLKILLHPSP